jgi:hypothetical protein
MLMEVELQKNGNIEIIATDEEIKFVENFMERDCPTPSVPYDDPYKYCKTCYYCSTGRGRYMECRIFTMMRDRRIYG